MALFTKRKQTKKVINALEVARQNKSRIRIYLGDTKTGESWNDEHDIMGYVGRSAGEIKIPLLLYNVNSHGGGGILDHCIIKIVETGTKRTLYEHENFHTGNFEIAPNNGDKKYSFGVTLDGKEHAYFENEAKAKRYIDFITGKRNSK